MTRRFTILGCGSSGGVPRPALGWGVCDPEQSEKPAPPHLAAGRATRSDGRHASPGRYLARSARAAARRRRRSGSTPCFIRTSTPTTPTASTTCADCSFVTAGAIDVYLDARTSQVDACALRLLLPVATGQRVSADRDRASPRPGPAVHDRRGRAARSPPCRILQEHGDIASLGFRFGALAYSCDLSHLPEAGADGACRRSRCGSWMRCATGPIPAISASTMRWAGSSASSPRRAILTNLHSDLDYEELKRRLPPHVEPAFDGMIVELAADR